MRGGVCLRARPRDADLRFETAAGILRCWRTPEQDDSPSIWAGPALAGKGPLAAPCADTRAVEVPLGPPGTPPPHPSLNLGNPHAIFFVPDVNAHDLARIGPLLETHPMFPERVNVSLATVAGPRYRDHSHLGTRRRFDQGLRLGCVCGRGRRRAAATRRP